MITTEQINKTQLKLLPGYLNRWDLEYRMNTYHRSCNILLGYKIRLGSFSSVDTDDIKVRIEDIVSGTFHDQIYEKLLPPAFRKMLQPIIKDWFI